MPRQPGHSRDLGSSLQDHLHELVEEIGPRPSGSPANRRATDYLRTVLISAGLTVHDFPFTTRWWEPGVSVLESGSTGRHELVANPFSTNCEVVGSVVRADALDDLKTADEDLSGSVVVLGPALGDTMIMPKGFPFLQIDEHQALIAALESRRPGAVVAASSRHLSLPTFEDADLAFPSLTVSPDLADALRPHEEVRIRFAGEVHEGHGVTVAARTPQATDGHGRIVISAHVDAKVTTPGAFDNAASVAAVLTLGESYGRDLGPVEFVFFNGEDHFDACGEQVWLAETDLARVAANVNLDGAGVAGRRVGITCLSCPDQLEAAIYERARRLGWGRMPQWFESDHAIFAMQGIPAVAVTSEDVHDLLTSVAHTSADTLDLVDVDVLADVVEGLRSIVAVMTSMVT